MNFRKKPIIVDAEQWFPGKKIDGVEEHSYDTIIRTLEGNMKVSTGDWVITGIAGEKYPCKDSIFKATYEPIVEEHEDGQASQQPRPSISSRLRKKGKD